jgi:hypothetical protein
MSGSTISPVFIFKKFLVTIGTHTSEGRRIWTVVKINYVVVVCRSESVAMDSAFNNLRTKLSKNRNLVTTPLEFDFFSSLRN